MVILASALLTVAAYAYDGHFADLKEGDIVFQNSGSSQSKYIAAATHSLWTHCGLIIEKPDGLYVLEASNVIKLTPLDKWKARGIGKMMKARRVFDKPIKVKYKKYLGLPYDGKFRMNNGTYYCSELVWHIYKTQFDHDFGLHPISDYNVGYPRTKAYMKKRGISDKELFIAPSDLL